MAFEIEFLCPRCRKMLAYFDIRWQAPCDSRFALQCRSCGCWFVLRLAAQIETTLENEDENKPLT